MHFVYLLYSKRYNKIYIGYSTDVEKRLISHNDPRSRGWTHKYRPWKLIYSESFDCKQEALIREKQLKSHGGRDFIRKVILKQ